MPDDPRVPYPMTVTFGTGAVGRARAFNRTTGEELSGLIDGSRRIVFDASNFTSGYTNGDVIEFRITGVRTGTGTHTINTSKMRGTISVDVTGTDNAFPSVNLG